MSYYKIVSSIHIDHETQLPSLLNLPRGNIFKSTPFDLNEDTWEHLGFEWFTLRNRTATDIGDNKWVITGYDPKTLDAYVVIVVEERPKLVVQ